MPQGSRCGGPVRFVGRSCRGRPGCLTRQRAASRSYNPGRLTLRTDDQVGARQVGTFRSGRRCLLRRSELEKVRRGAHVAGRRNPPESLLARSQGMGAARRGGSDEHPHDRRCWSAWWCQPRAPHGRTTRGTSRSPGVTRHPSPWTSTGRVWYGIVLGGGTHEQRRREPSRSDAGEEAMIPRNFKELPRARRSRSDTRVRACMLGTS